MGIILFVLIGGPILALFLMHRPLPEASPSPEADLLAEKMLKAIDKPAWDTTQWIQWSYSNRGIITWDRHRHLVKIEWKNGKSALVNPDNRKGLAFLNGQPLEGDNADALVQKATSDFFNDSFWLLAPNKVFDPGTLRSIVPIKNSDDQGLLVSYSTGGVTPGDSYLWRLDKNGLPKSYRMWVGVLPIGGLKATWEDWKTLPSGAKYAASHIILGFYDGTVSNVKSGSSWIELGFSQDPFQDLMVAKNGLVGHNHH